ncbi:MAG: Fe-S cluster assembly protein SufB [Candidatus Aenigmatarchaeota archaeon]
MDIVFEKIEEQKEKEWFRVEYKPEIVIKGPLTEEKIRKIWEIKEEPDWMLDIRLKAFKVFQKLPMPSFGPKLEINFDEIIYYGSALRYPKPRKWEELPEFIRETFRRLGISKEEVEALGSASLQFDSIPAFKKVRKELEEQGVIFSTLDEAVREYPEIVKKYFGKAISYSEHKFAALNTAVWSGGVFIYVPKNVKVKVPLHAYFRINLENIGQFERTLIIAEENSEVSYVEGCSAPIYSASSLHAAVVEAFAKRNSKLRYYTIQNWSKNVYNLVTKRAIVENNAHVQWVSIELGSKATMLYPSLILKNNCIGEIYNLSISHNGQHIDSGGKLIFIGKNSRGNIISKSIAIGKNAISTSRFDVIIKKSAKNSLVISKCDSLSLKDGKIETIPRYICENKSSLFNHEGKSEIIDEEKLLFLASKGISEEVAKKLIYLGYFEDVLETLPDFFKLEVLKLLNVDLEEYGGFG